MFTFPPSLRCGYSASVGKWEYLIAMCFSAAASFSSSALLAATGVVTIYKAGNTPRRVFAGIPLVFAVQQLIEGVLWMSLSHPSWHLYREPSTYLFQVFAQMVWPVYMPLLAILFENERKKKHLLLVLLSFGIALSSYSGFGLYRYPVYAFAQEHHIRYISYLPLAQKWYYGVLYFLPTIIAPAVSNVKYLRWLAGLFFISYVITRIFFHFYEISVWCFFGAVISFSVFFMSRQLQKK